MRLQSAGTAAADSTAVDIFAWFHYPQRGGKQIYSAATQHPGSLRSSRLNNAFCVRELLSHGAEEAAECLMDRPAGY
jgi:hypothetical protein